MIELKNVSFTYAGGREGAGLRDVSLTVSPGEAVLLCGGSGCGKTTLTRLLNGLIPHYYEGALTGTVMVAGRMVADTPLYDMAGIVGSVFQNPRSQFFNVDTTSELAFSCENLGMTEQNILSRVEETEKALSLSPLMDRSIFQLSGGEKQKIACGCVHALGPEVFVLDEPTSNLDAEGIAALKEVIAYWKQQGKTIVIAEHRLHFLSGLADRVIWLKDGRIAEEYDGKTFFSQPPEFYRGRGLRAVSLDHLWAAAGGVQAAEVSSAEPDGAQTQAQAEVCTLENFCYGYARSKPVLAIRETELPLGRVYAVVGRNGAGKTTLMRSLCGLLNHDKSILRLHGKKLTAKKRLPLCYLVMQDVNHQLFTESVLDEVLLSMKEEDIPAAEEILEGLDLLPLKDVHPMSLSGGQKQRVAIASALAAECEILVFDEPTSGLDFSHMEQVAAGIRSLQARNKTVFIVTHDPEFIAACCSHVLHLKEGRIDGCYSLDEAGAARLKILFSIE